MIMPCTSSFGIEVEVGQLFSSKVDIKMRLFIMSLNNNFKYRLG